MSAPAPAGRTEPPPVGPRVRGPVAAGVIARRELIRFTRQPARIAAAIGMPCLIWLLLAGGFARGLHPLTVGEVGYASWLLPGMMTLVAVLAAIFSSLSIIEDRRDGSLAAVLMAPVPRWSIAAGRIGGGALLACLQAASLLAVSRPLGLHVGLASLPAIVAGLAATALGMTAVGVAFAWRTETPSGYHAVMNLLFAPLWFLSGSIFPPQASSPWLARLVAINPLAWCTEAIRGPMTGHPPGWALPAAAGFAAAAFAVATWIVAAPQRS